jgi:hypothetical protein
MKRRTNVKKMRRRLNAKTSNLSEIELENVSYRQTRKLATRARIVIDKAEGRYKS